MDLEVVVRQRRRGDSLADELLGLGVERVSGIRGLVGVDEGSAGLGGVGLAPPLEGGEHLLAIGLRGGGENLLVGDLLGRRCGLLRHGDLLGQTAERGPASGMTMASQCSLSVWTKRTGERR